MSYIDQWAETGNSNFLIQLLIENFRPGFNVHPNQMDISAIEKNEAFYSGAKQIHLGPIMSMIAQCDAQTLFEEMKKQERVPNHGAINDAYIKTLLVAFFNLMITVAKNYENKTKSFLKVADKFGEKTFNTFRKTKIKSRSVTQAELDLILIRTASHILRSNQAQLTLATEANKKEQKKFAKKSDWFLYMLLDFCRKAKAIIFNQKAFSTPGERQSLLPPEEKPKAPEVPEKGAWRQQPPLGVKSKTAPTIPKQDIEEEEKPVLGKTKSLFGIGQKKPEEKKHETPTMKL